MARRLTEPGAGNVAVRLMLGVFQAAAFLALALMLGLTTFEVVLRALFGVSLEVSEELAGYTLAGLVFFGAPRVMMVEGLLRVDIFYARFQGSWKRAADMAFLVLALIICGIYLYQIGRLVVSSFTRDTKSTTMFETPQYLPQIMLVMGLAGVACVLIYKIVLAVRSGKPATAVGASTPRLE